MNIILYSNVCPCVLKSLQMVRRFVADNGAEFIKKRTSYNEANRSEAMAIGAESPFLYNDINGKTISAHKVTEEKLEWLIK